MRAKSVALLVLALGCGLVASLGITQVLAKRGGDPAAAAETQGVLVAVKDIPLGSLLTSQVTKLEEWPKDRVPAGALTRMEDVEGRRSRAKFYVGEPILEQKLFGKGMTEQGADALIPKGYRVVSVRVEAVTVHGGLLMPGSRVDIQVYISRNPAGGIAETTTRTLLQDIKVFAVNDVISMDTPGQDTKSIQGRTVSLLVTPEQAEKVTLASELGTIRLIMRSPDDDVQVDTRGALPQELFGDSKGARREKETLVQESATPAKDSTKGFVDYLNSIRTKLAAAKLNVPPDSLPQEAPRWTMRLLKGPEINEIELEGNPPALAANADLGWKATNGMKSSPVASAIKEPRSKRLLPPEEPKAESQEPISKKTKMQQIREVLKGNSVEPKTGAGEPKPVKDG